MVKNEKQRSGDRRLRLTAAVTAAGLCMASFLIPSYGAQKQYSDIRGTECEEAVNFLSEEQILSGYEDGTFRPEAEITRAEVAKMFAALLTGSDVSVLLPESAAERLPQEEAEGTDGEAGGGSGNEAEAENDSGSQEENAENDGGAQQPELSEAEKYAQQLSESMGEESSMRELALSLYDDLENSVWSQPYIAVASLCGIVNGYGDRTFRPQGNITYNELAAICVRAAGIGGEELTGSWPDNYVSAAEEMGLYRGMKDFDPEESDGSEAASRGNTAIAVYHAYESIQEQARAGYEIPGDVISVLLPLPETELSLEEAVERIQTEGTQAEAAQMSRRSDEAIAAGYQDTASSISDSLDIMKFLPLEQQYQLQQSGVTKYNLELTRLQRDFVKENIDNNYEADMNQIARNTIQLYYGLLQAEKNVEVCEDTLASERRTLDLVQKKYELGAASAIEVKTQENSVAVAEDSLVQAENTAESTRANFLMLMGMEADTEIVLTTELEKTDLEIPSLSEALDSMLKNNLELKYYDYMTEVTDIQIQSLRYTTNHSSTAYKNAELAYDQAQMAISQMTEAKETSLRTAYEELSALESQISRYESLIDLTEKSLELAKVQYENGLTTMSEIESAQLTLTQSQQALMNAIVSYNEAVYDILFETGVGTTRISFS